MPRRHLSRIREPRQDYTVLYTVCPGLQSYSSNPSKPCDRDSQAISTWVSCKRHAARGKRQATAMEACRAITWCIRRGGLCTGVAAWRASSMTRLITVQMRELSLGGMRAIHCSSLVACRHRPFLPPPCCTAFCAPWPPRMKMWRTTTCVRFVPCCIPQHTPCPNVSRFASCCSSSLSGHSVTT
jgi:hypothetical protein